jgi:ABC-type lipoprotein release transport system permease subunit
MVFWIKLAFKNIFRSKQRTILTLIPVIFGVMLLITMFSLLDGLNRDSINNLINFETASLKLVSKNFSLSDKKLDINEIYSPGRDNQIFDQFRHGRKFYL